jgi:hypothetical protein
MHRIVLDREPLDFLDWRVASGGTVEIVDIQAGSARREGKGRRLVRRLYRDMPAGVPLVWALTRTENAVANSFYAALGFRAMAVLRDFYGRGEDAVMFGIDRDRIPDGHLLLKGGV